MLKLATLVGLLVANSGLPVADLGAWLPVALSATLAVAPDVGVLVADTVGTGVVDGVGLDVADRVGSCAQVAAEVTTVGNMGTPLRGMSVASVHLLLCASSLSTQPRNCHRAALPTL